MNKPATSTTPRQSALECPIDGSTVNENKVRTVAFFVLQIGIAYLFTANWFLPFFLFVDFALRAFDFGKFSLLGLLSNGVVNVLHFPVQLTSQAPKRFAAGVGMAVTALMLAFHVAGIDTRFLTILLLIFASMESLAGFCAGCYVYTFLKGNGIIRQ